MNLTDLTKLSPDELRLVSRRNLILFATVTPLDLGVFYYSLFQEHWIAMFLSLGIFIASLAIYDNYKIAQTLLESNRSTI